jgi:ELWxxDGT repeat protein
MLLEDLEAGPEGSTIRFIIPSDDREDRAVFVVVRDTPGGEVPELWATDGTPSGTQRIEAPGLELRIETLNFWWTPDYLVFAGHDPSTGTPGVWRTDGTTAGTVELAAELALDTPHPRPTGSGTVVFSARPAGETSLELWVTDGTPAGTRRIRELGLDREDSPRFLVLEELEGTVYYLDAAPDDSAVGLWRTDGTAGGTELVRAPDGTSFRWIDTTETALWLSTRDGDQETEALWISDGTAAGTVEAYDFGSQRESVGLSFVIGLPGGRSLWRVHTQDVSPSLWVTDGTGEGTLHLLDAPRISAIHGPVERIGDRAYLTVDRDQGGRDLWGTDGTPEGTEVVFDGMPGLDSGLSFLLSEAAGRLLLDVERPELGFEPWISDGTTEGTELLADVCPGACSSNAYNWVETGGPVLFTASTTGGNTQLFATDLTTAGTRRITDFAGEVLRPFNLSDGSLGHQLLLGGRFLFTADDGVHGTELWSLTVPDAAPLPPAGPWLRPAEVPGFEIKVRITPPGGAPVTGALEPACIPETACISGALPGRSEVFVRVVGPKPNGRLWPTLVKLTTSQVDVWIRQIATGAIRHYRLEGASPGFDELPGLFDRQGFEP